MSASVPAPKSIVLDRPFYFTIVLWGERLRNYFLDLCLPTLLSAGNLPALSTHPRSKFMIFTLPNGWAAIKVAPIFRLLEKHVDPIFVVYPNRDIRSLYSIICGQNAVRP
jgi:hypothetical protein